MSRNPKEFKDTRTLAAGLAGGLRGIGSTCDVGNAPHDYLDELHQEWKRSPLVFSVSNSIGSTSVNSFGAIPASLWILE